MVMLVVVLVVVVVIVMVMVVPSCCVIRHRLARQKGLRGSHFCILSALLLRPRSSLNTVMIGRAWRLQGRQNSQGMRGRVVCDVFLDLSSAPRRRGRWKPGKWGHQGTH